MRDSFAEHVVRYGFIVAVPKHWKSFALPGFAAEGLFSEMQQMHDAPEYVKTNGNIYKIKIIIRGAPPFRRGASLSNTGQLNRVKNIYNMCPWVYI